MYNLIIKDEKGEEVLNKNCHIASVFWMEDEKVEKRTFDDVTFKDESKANAILGINSLMCQEAAMYSRTLLDALIPQEETK